MVFVGHDLVHYAVYERAKRAPLERIQDYGSRREVELFPYLVAAGHSYPLHLGEERPDDFGEYEGVARDDAAEAVVVEARRLGEQLQRLAVSVHSGGVVGGQTREARQPLASTGGRVLVYGGSLIVNEPVLTYVPGLVVSQRAFPARDAVRVKPKVIHPRPDMAIGGEFGRHAVKRVIEAEGLVVGTVAAVAVLVRRRSHDEIAVPDDPGWLRMVGMPRIRQDRVKVRVGIEPEVGRGCGQSPERVVSLRGESHHFVGIAVGHLFLSVVVLESVQHILEGVPHQRLRVVERAVSQFIVVCGDASVGEDAPERVVPCLV